MEGLGFREDVRAWGLGFGDVGGFLLPVPL